MEEVVLIYFDDLVKTISIHNNFGRVRRSNIPMHNCKLAIYQGKRGFSRLLQFQRGAKIFFTPSSSLLLITARALTLSCIMLKHSSSLF